ncbi:TetR/AcrR family transcriptional regulator [Thermosulfidibacter takaii]|nr:TetR/AcrR family transcriptional regulator [Thermosulfidibacter takaii]
MKKQVREKILARAFRLFATKGFAATRVEDIAKQARVNKATIYYYFDSKAALYEEVIYNEVLSIAPRVVEVACNTQSLEGFLDSVVDVYFDFLKGNPDAFRLFVREVCDGGKHLKNVLKRIKKEQSFFEKGGIASYLGSLGFEERTGLDSLDFWLSIMGMASIHLLAEPFLEVLYSVPLDEQYWERRRAFVKRLVNKVVSCAG